jgi:hypothetical protein
MAKNIRDNSAKTGITIKNLMPIRPVMRLASIGRIITQKPAAATPVANIQLDTSRKVNDLSLQGPFSINV